MNLVDVHCHLNHQKFQKDLGQVIERAGKAGVKVIICSGVNRPTNQEALALSKKYPLLKPSFGLYPIDLLNLTPDEVGLTRQTEKINLEEELEFIKEHQAWIAAIGEVGMDFHWAKKEETWSKQAENFRKIIRFALKLKKPLIIHSREAEEECLDILEEEIQNQIPVIMHCFSGRKSLMTRAINLGYYFSIPPIIIKSTNFQNLAKKAPLAQLLTETDAPWLSPYPDKRNEPAFVAETIRKIAQIKNLKETEVADQIWQNYLKIFPK